MTKRGANTFNKNNADMYICVILRLSAVKIAYATVNFT